jgi:hypothetical protein
MCRGCSEGIQVNPEEQYARTFDVMGRVGLSVGEVWLHYLGMGGDVDEYEVDAYLHGLIQLPELDRNLIALAVNELYDDVCREPRAPFSQELKRRNQDH